MVTGILKKVFGTSNDRVLNSIRPLVRRVNELEPTYQAMSDDELRGQTALFRERLAKGEPLDSLQAEAFAVVREAGRRVLGMRHFDVQIIGGAVLHSGKIAEMKTGEGKTLVATLPAYLNALPGKGVHVVTVNDYLARRDAEWMGRIHTFLGLSVGCIFHGMNEEQKRAAYACDITYGQNNEFGFDYLRDNMKFTADEMMQRGHFYAIVDEVDSILIDEARTPLIISGPAEDATDKYYRINKIIPHLKAGTDFEVDLKSKQPSLTEEGVAHCEQLLGVENLYDPSNIETLHHVNQGLRAYTTLERDVDYVVNQGQVIIVDEFTGRLMPGRRWSNGLHQAVEAKENLKVQRENQTLASITFQNLFRMYSKLSGMTGTADTEAAEFKEIYRLDVVVIPPNRPMVRDDQSDVVFKTKNDKFTAVCEDIAQVHETGQPILVGTISIEQSEALSKKLGERGITHKVLNAKHHEREAEIVAQAGRWKAVTIATNMAGRGTDIVLGGNPEFLAMAEAKTRDRQDPAYIEAHARFAAECASGRERVLEAGGLFIMGTERHESRRIDNQLRGRAGRQGDPGISRFYVSLEDDLMLRFGGERIQAIMSRIGWDDGMPIDGRMISRSIETAQKRVEHFHFDARKHVTEYDDVMNKQRQVIYNLRSKILHNEGLRGEILDMIEDLIEESVLTNCDPNQKRKDWKFDALEERLKFLTNIDIKVDRAANDTQAIFDSVREQVKAAYAKKVEQENAKLFVLQSYQDNQENDFEIRISRSQNKPLDFGTVEQDTLLETLDYLWNQNLQEMDELREGIGLRGYGQKNPLYEYQREGFQIFQQLLATLREVVVRKLFFSEVPEPHELLRHIEEERQRREQLQQQMQLTHGGEEEEEGAEGQTAGGGDSNKTPDEQRAKIAAQRKARRKAGARG